MQENKGITIIIDFKIYYYLFELVIKQFQKRGVEVYLVCHQEIEYFIRDQADDLQGVKFLSLTKLKKRYKYRKAIHRVLGMLFTRHNFSHQYTKRVRQITVKATGAKKALYAISRYIPQVSNQNINGFLHSITGVFLKNPFPTRKVLVGSLNASPELICGRGLKVITLMESWDHPVKVPNGYKSDKVIVWNKELGDDWIENQYDKQVNWVYPLKLRYAIEKVNKKNLWKKYQNTQGKPLCVYAVASTRVFSVPQIVDIEQRLISDLCEATRDAGWDFMIKPRPHGDLHEFDHFLESFDHVSLGHMADASENPADYYLGDDYNETRFKEVLSARLVINCFTTFGLDAAVAGIPVLQLDLRKANGYLDSGLFYANHHINKYLITDRPTLKVPSDQKVVNFISNYLKNPQGLEYQYTAAICKWLIPDFSIEEGLDNIVNLTMDEN